MKKIRVRLEYDGVRFIDLKTNKFMDIDKAISLLKRKMGE